MSKAMVSRSMRIHSDTLDVLKIQAEIQGLGITVYIRRALEALVEQLLLADENPGNTDNVLSVTHNYGN